MADADGASAVAQSIRAADRILLAAHENPDGDAVGSILALRSMLRSLGKTVHAALPDPPPERFAFLDEFDDIANEPPPWTPELAIALDCDGADRLVGLREAVLSAETVVDIDHHQGIKAFGDIRFVASDAPATATLVVAVADELGLLPPTPVQATALYAALIADTGCFRFTNTTPEALRMGAELVQAGADPADIARRVFSVKPLSAVLLQARALDSLKVADGVAIATLTLADFADTGATPYDTEGIIDSFRDVPGVEAAALLKETEPRSWQVSLRGNGVNVAGVASRFGGGGHEAAAGCTIEGDREAVVEELREALRPVVEARSHA